MPEYEVGKPYIPCCTAWPELGEYTYRHNSHELRLFVSNLSPSDITAIGAGPAAFALVVEQPLLLLLYSFGEARPWAYAPFSWHTVPQSQRTIPQSPVPAEGVQLQIVLINADSGVIEALRSVALSPEFSLQLHETICEQVEQPFSQAEYEARLKHVALEYPSAAALLHEAEAQFYTGAE